MPLRLFNTLTRKKEFFKPARGKTARFYACGPTVYQEAHLGNLRTYINEDILKRVLLLDGYKVKHVMNITDVGHLEHDSDTGEDKVEKEAREKHKSAWEIASKYEKIFKRDLKKLDILPPELFPRATGHIKEQIGLVKKLEAKGFTYPTSDGIYFNTARFKKYGVLVKSKLRGLRAGVRTELREKKNPTDFALWKFSPKTGPRRQMEWPSPWGAGFPGWHLECSAMSIKYLGMPIDIHAGGIDHIHPHHTNEIAQSEAAYGRKFANFWMHSEFLLMKEGRTRLAGAEPRRMGKSEGNAITLLDIEKRGFEPLDFRYLTLTAHYRSPLSFGWKSLESSRNARLKLEKRVLWARERKNKKDGLASFRNAFLRRINDDLDAPRALSLLWKQGVQYEEFLLSDMIFGLGFDKIKPLTSPTAVQNLLETRERLRLEKKWGEADKIRDKIRKLGFLVEDTPEGPRLKRAT